MRSIESRPSALTALATVAVIVSACGGTAPIATVDRAIPLPSYPAASAAVAVGADTVGVLPRGITAFPVIRGLIGAATVAVEVEMYELQRDDLVGDLEAAQRRGVRVTVIVDPSVTASAAAAERLRAAGVDALAYPVRAQMIDHVKLLVVDDGAVAVVGGINWGNASAPNHDVDLLLRGPAAHNLHRVFVRDLVTCGRPGTVPPLAVDPAVEVVATLPTPAIRPPILQAIEAARSSIDLELYVLTDLGIVHALERAHGRGVRIRLLLDPTERPSDAPAAELRAGGVPVRLYRGAGELLHAKTMVVDGRTVVAGSANWSAGGFARNHELDVVLRDSATVAAVLVAAENSDWERSDGDVTAPASGGADAEAA